MNLSTDSEALKRLLIERSVKKGNFILASGKESTVYVDARLTTMSPEGMVTIGPLALSRIDAEGWKPDSIGGLTMGADPVSFAISHTSAIQNRPIRAFSVRKEAKSHGTGNRIEGPFKSGDNVIIVEDVITTGKSAIQAIDAVEAAGGKIIGVIAVVDRQDGGREAIRARGYGVVALATIDELIR
ncbi:MAG TPA: orotate phosphoribosyltransferase [Gemmatimonadaceae bacterium]